MLFPHFEPFYPISNTVTKQINMREDAEQMMIEQTGKFTGKLEFNFVSKTKIIVMSNDNNDHDDCMKA